MCDMCEINFESLADLGEHITKKHQRKKEFCCVYDGNFFTKMDLDKHYTDVNTSYKIAKVKNGKKGNKK